MTTYLTIIKCMNISQQIKQSRLVRITLYRMNRKLFSHACALLDTFYTQASTFTIKNQIQSRFPLNAFRDNYTKRNISLYSRYLDVGIKYNSRYINQLISYDYGCVDYEKLNFVYSFP